MTLGFCLQKSIFKQLPHEELIAIKTRTLKLKPASIPILRHSRMLLLIALSHMRMLQETSKLAKALIFIALSHKWLPNDMRTHDMTYAEDHTA